MSVQQNCSQSPPKKKGIRGSKISKLFTDESKLINNFIKTGFIKRIKKRDVEYAVTKFFEMLVFFMQFCS